MHVRDRVWSSAIVVAAVAVLLVNFVVPDVPFRPIVALGFLLVCPGMAMVRRLRLADGLAEFVLAVAVSLALEMLASLVMIYGGIWSPNVLLILLAAGCLFAGWSELKRPIVRAERS